MSFVRTLVLLAVAAGLGSWYWLVEVPQIEEEARADLLVDVDPADVEKVRLSYRGGAVIEAVREDGQWRLTSPVDYAAENSAVDGFLNTVHDTKIERRMPSAEAGELASYGLDGDVGSQARLELTARGGRALPAVVLGGTTPVGYQAFARREDSGDVLVIPLLLQSSARKNPDDLRRKSMFGAAAGDVRAIRIERLGETIALQREDNGAWTLRSPFEDEADAEVVRSMLDSIPTIDALAFFDGEAADREAFGLADGATVFAAERGDGSTIGFRLGTRTEDAPAGTYFERSGDGQVVKVADWVSAKFAPTVNGLRQRRVLSCRPDEILSMTWSAPSAPFTISRGGPGQPWTISPHVSTEVLNQRIVENVVRSLGKARADEVVGDAPSEADLSSWGLDAPTAGLEVKAASGPCATLVAAAVPAPEAAAAGSPPKRLYFLKDARRTAVLRASEHEYSRIAMKRSEFVDAAPTEQPAGPDTPATD